jgi:hypothetical protein
MAMWVIGCEMSGSTMKVQFINDIKEVEHLASTQSFKDIGSYVEKSVVDVLYPFVPPAYLYTNPSAWTISDNQTIEFTDMLFWYESTLLIIECKGRKLHAAEDLRDNKKIDRWLSNKLGKAQKQLLRAKIHLENNKSVIGKKDDEVIFIDFSNINYIIPMVVVFEASDFFWQPMVIDRKRKYPEIQILDLRALLLLSVYLQSANEVVSYFQQKQNLCKTFPEFMPYEENLLIYFMSNNKSFKKLIGMTSQKELIKKFSYDFPRGISPSHLYDTSADTVKTVIDMFSVISAIGIEKWNNVQDQFRKNRDIT